LSHDCLKILLGSSFHDIPSLVADMRLLFLADSIKGSSFHFLLRLKVLLVSETFSTLTDCSFPSGFSILLLVGLAIGFDFEYFGLIVRTLLLLLAS
jgi:hypothetical protein